MQAEINTSVAKLNKNYFMWKFKMEMLLIKEDFQDFLTKKKQKEIQAFGQRMIIKVFLNLDTTLKKIIVLVNNETVVSKAEGTIKIKLNTYNNDYNSITFRNVLYTPTVNNNIMLEKQYTEKGCKVNFYEINCMVNKGGETLVYKIRNMVIKILKHFQNVVAFKFSIQLDIAQNRMAWPNVKIGR